MDLSPPLKATRAGLYGMPESENGEADVSSQPSSDSDDTVTHISEPTAWLLESKDKSFGIDSAEQPYRSFRQRMIERSLLLGVPLPLETAFDHGVAVGSKGHQQDSQDSFHGEYPTPDSQISLNPNSTAQGTATSGFCNSPDCSQAMSLCSTQQWSQGNHSSTQESQAMSLCERSQVWVTMVDCGEPQTNNSPQQLTTLSRQESFSVMSEASTGTSFTATLAAFPLPPVTESAPFPPPIPPRPVTRAAKIKEMQEKLINATSKRSEKFFFLFIKPPTHSPFWSPGINTNDIKQLSRSETPRAGHHLPKCCGESRGTKANEYTTKSVLMKPRPVMVENATDSEDDTTDKDDEEPAFAMARGTKNHNKIENDEGKPQWPFFHSPNLRQALQRLDAEGYEGEQGKKKVKRENSSPLPTQQKLDRKTLKGLDKFHTNTPSFYNSFSLSPTKLQSLQLQPQQSPDSLPGDGNIAPNVRKRCRGNTSLYLKSPPSTFTPLIVSTIQTHRETLLKKNNEAMIELLRVDCRSRIQRYSAERIAHERSLKGATPATHGDSSHLLHLKGAGLAFVDETRRTVEAVKRICTEQLMILGKIEVEYLLGGRCEEDDPWASATASPNMMVGDDDEVLQSMSEDGGSSSGRRVRTKTENGMAPLMWNNAQRTELKLQKLSLRESGFGGLELPGMVEDGGNEIKGGVYEDSQKTHQYLGVTPDQDKGKATTLSVVASHS